MIVGIWCRSNVSKLFAARKFRFLATAQAELACVYGFIDRPQARPVTNGSGGFSTLEVKSEKQRDLFYNYSFVSICICTTVKPVREV